MNEADRRLLEAAGLGFFGLGPLADAMALEAAMDGASGELGVEAAAHYPRLRGDRLSTMSSSGRSRLVRSSQTSSSSMAVREMLIRFGRCERSWVGGAASPAVDGLRVHAELDGQFRHRGGAGLDVGPDFGRGGGVGVQSLPPQRRGFRRMRGAP